MHEMSKTKKLIVLAGTSLLMICLVFVACGQSKSADQNVDKKNIETIAEDSSDKSSEEESMEPEGETVSKPEQDQGVETKDDSKEDKNNSVEKQSNQTTDKKKEKKKQASSSGKKQSADPAKQAAAPAKKTKKVWVDPVYETRTVKSTTGTRYCNGANSGGGCGASWHGTKNDTFASWKAHWQAYVKKHTDVDPEWQCDHVHDDSRWVPDPPSTEQVLVKEGYWKEVAE